MAVDHNFDLTKPIDHLLIADIPSEIRGVKSDAVAVLLKEHVEPATGCGGGQHLKGSARVYLESGLPTLDPEGNSLATGADTSDVGRLAADTSVATGNLIRVYIATSAGVATGWKDLRVAYAGTSYELAARANIDANNNSIVNLKNDTYITAYGASGISTGFNIIKLNADNLPEFGDVEAIIMTSVMTSVATATARRVANRGFVVDQIEAKVSTFGDWASKSTNTAYEATTAGFVVVYGNTYSNEITILSDASNPPTTTRCSALDNGGDHSKDCLICPVKKGGYWKVTGTATIFWIPLQ